MSISYSGLRTYGKATLPSVETWGNNMGIVKDPPKGIITRRIDKVGDTSLIVSMVGESADRVSEQINPYARGVDPMVAVSYSNYGTNGGQHNSGFFPVRNGQAQSVQAYLPYTIAKYGAFQPPVRPPQDLLPLSRLPRVWTSSFTQPGFADFAKKLLEPQEGDKTAGVKKNDAMLRTSTYANPVVKVNLPIIEPFEVKNVIKNLLPIQNNQNIGTISYQPVNNIQTSVEGAVRDTTLHYETTTNKKGMEQTNYMSTEINQERNLPSYSVSANKTMLGELRMEQTELSLDRNLPSYSTRTNNSQNIYIRPEQQVMREQTLNRPYTQATTNHGTNRPSSEFISRQVNLHPKIHAGSFENQGIVPQYQYSQPVPIQELTGDFERQNLNKRVLDMQMERNFVPAPWGDANH